MHNGSPALIVVPLLLLLASGFAGSTQAFHFAFYISALTLTPFLFLPHWPFNLLIPFLLYLAVVLSMSRHRNEIVWLRAGRIDKNIVLLIITSAVISGMGLYVWYRALKPDLSGHIAYIPSMPVWVFPFAGLGFSVFNAAMEEFVFRGIIMQSLDSAFGPGALSIIVQAWLFGALHYQQGLPNGLWGLGMVFIYGIMLGVIRRRSGGMLAPWVAHICADMVIFTILSAIVLGKQG
jgi:membrane protease YdiL (CAAX protease family)